LKVAVTGATGTIGRAVVQALLERGNSVVALSRNVETARAKLGGEVEVHEWRDPKAEPAPAAAFADVEGVIHLLGEPVAQRWSDGAKEEIRDSRVLGTRNLIEGLRAAAGPRLDVVVAQSASPSTSPRPPAPTSWPAWWSPGRPRCARVPRSSACARRSAGPAWCCRRLAVRSRRC
jgi:uncharacterized protein